MGRRRRYSSRRLRSGIQYVTGRFLETLPLCRAEQGVQQDVVGFESGVGFEFAAPVTFFVLLREEEFACRIDSDCDPAAQVVNLSESHLRHRGRTRGGVIVHQDSTAALAGAAAMASTISGGSRSGRSPA